MLFPIFQMVCRYAGMPVRRYGGMSFPRNLQKLLVFRSLIRNFAPKRDEYGT